MLCSALRQVLLGDVIEEAVRGVAKEEVQVESGLTSEVRSSEYNGQHNQHYQSSMQGRASQVGSLRSSIGWKWWWRE